jgi:outer membrane protein assembly factor BamB
MARRFSLLILGMLLLTGVVLLAGCVSNTPPAGGPSGPAAAAIPPEVSQYAKDWPLPNKDYESTRATTDSTISTATVKNLEVTWMMPITASGTFGGASSNPLIMGNTVYFQDLLGRLFSIDRQTGAVNWMTTFDSLGVVGPNGPAVGYGKVFGPSNQYSISAVSMTNGTRLWTTNLSFGAPIGILDQPILYNGMVLISTVPSGYKAGAAGIIYALDQETGKVLWQFNTIQSPDFWGHPELNSGGGCWFPASVDVGTGNSFWGTGNPAPFAGTPEYPNGASRPGNNLYCDSIVVLNKSGNLEWYTQTIAHDNTDMDFQLSPILTTANINGITQEIAIGGGKWGRVFAFNRSTGAILWETPVGIHQNDNLVNLPNETVIVYPGYQGGIETPMAYADGVVYVPTINLYAKWAPTISFPPGGGLEPYANGTSNLTAIQVDTGKILWETNFDSEIFSSATVVNDLVFVATYNGMISALDKDTGEIVWTYQAPGLINAWPAVAGNTLVWPVGSGTAPSVVAFSIGTPGAAPQLGIARPAPGATVEGSTVVVTAWVKNFALVNKPGQANVAGEGHLHYFLDVDAPTTPGQPAITAAGTYVATPYLYTVWSNVTTGTHTLSVELVNNDNTPLNPPVVESVTITVVPLPPGATPEPTPVLSQQGPL